MDKDVIIRFIEFLDNIFGRINSKRLMIYLSLLLFFSYAYTKCSDLNVQTLILWLAFSAAILACIAYFFRTPDDKMNAAKVASKVPPAV